MPAADSASRSRRAVRTETSSSAATSPAVTRLRACSSRSVATSRSALTSAEDPTESGQEMACYGSRVRLDEIHPDRPRPEQREAASMPAHVPPVADERAGLLEFLAHQRRQVRTATFGLSDAEAAATPSASSLSLGGIVKHLAHVERNWADIIRATPRMTFE